MKVLIYGSKGWIGEQFVQICKNSKSDYIVGLTHCENVYDLENEIKTVQPTHIISFIGRTHGKIDDKVYTTIDYLEQEGKLVENVRDNLFSPMILAMLAKKHNIHYTYLGTGCIFKFDETHPFGKEIEGFTEDSKPNFFGSSYSIVKGFTDQLMQMYDNSVLNLRIRMPITGEQNARNFITKITTYEKICSIPNSMTVLPELLPIVLDMMKNKTTGTINLTNPGLISHNEILEMFKEIVDPEFTWSNFTAEEQRKILASDRSNNFLDTSKLQSLYPQVKNIKDSVRDMLVQYTSSYTKKQTVLANQIESSKLTIEPKLIENQIDKIKTLFITGGAGFIGSIFINYFCKKYPDIPVINFDALYYCADINNVDESIRNSPNYKFIEGNLQSYDLLKHIFQSNEITHVIHFAAQSHVQNSFNDSLSFTQDNVLGTHNLLEVNRRYNKHLLRFIHVSTDEVYGESMLDVDEKHKTEHSILCPTNPYAATKAGAELMAQSYNHSFKMPIIITRGNNVYGPNQYPEKVIPRFIKQLKEDKKVTIQGNGSCVRAFLHAYDTATAFETVLLKGTIGEIYNIGCDEGMEFSIMDVAKILIKMIKNTEDYDQWIDYIEDRPFNDTRYYISNQKLKNLGWDIKIDLLTGLEHLIKPDYKMNLINLKILDKVTDMNNYFGSWINDLTNLNNQFINGDPFSYVKIDNFLNEDFAELLFSKFPVDYSKWHKYWNPIEVKYACDNLNKMDENFAKLFYLLSTEQVTEMFRKISSIDNLEYDPYLNGAGLHVHPRYGRLHMHLDYEKHPKLVNKERRLNIILFLTKDWKEEWNGDNQLWDKEMKECKVKTYPKFNSAILFQTNEISWHGLPDKILCPEGIFRKSLAYYYISPLTSQSSEIKVGNDGSGYRSKATFIKRPEDPKLEQMEKLYKIRPLRRIEQSDMEKIWPEWKPELF
jgi:dTDP-glucose 4,6-dehydratase